MPLNKKIESKIASLRALLNRYNLDGYIIPSWDQWQNEFTVPEYQRLKWVSGFSGSNGIGIIGKSAAFLLTDSRYIIQAENEVCKDIWKIKDISVIKYKKEVKNEIKAILSSYDGKIGYDPMLFAANNITKYSEMLGLENNIISIENNFIDEIWNQKNTIESNNSIKNKQDIKDCAFLLDISLTGESAGEKIHNILNILDQSHIDTNYHFSHYFLSALGSICWLLNIRGNDVPYTPLLMSYLLLDVTKRNKHQLFVNLDKIDHNMSNYFEQLGVNLCPLDDMMHLITDLLAESDITIAADPDLTPDWLFLKGKELNNNIEKFQDPCIALKAIKNKVEQRMLLQTHIKDSIAVTQFLSWFNEITKQEVATINLNEAEAAEKLLQYRKKISTFLYSSFPTISSFQENSAIVHYSPKPDNCKSILTSGQVINHNSGIYLIDSGGQYFGGTTDVTRTIIIGEATLQQKLHFTIVLKSHIALASSKFPKNTTTGKQLDAIARKNMWDLELDYGHSTGHGVGYCLNVHEYPPSIGQYSESIIKEGMVLSIEPGCYIKGEYGIRCENLYLVQETQPGSDYLEFYPLTLVPFDDKLILLDNLTIQERKWLTDYNAKIQQHVLDINCYS